MVMVKLSRIRTDGTQTRATMKPEITDEYAERMVAGDKFPEIVLFEDISHDLWLGDGFYRTYAALKNQYQEIDAKVKNGTQQDAILYSAGCNDTHGLKRTNEDKRNAVRMLLDNPEWAKASNTWIAEKCRVSDHFVADVRKNGKPKTPPKKTDTKPEEETTSEENSDSGSQTRTSTENSDASTNGKQTSEPKKPGGTSHKKERRKGKDGKEYPARKKSKRGDSWEPKKSTKTTDPLKDNHGNDIPQKRRDAWADPWIQEAYDFLCMVSEKFRHERLADGMDKRKKHFPFFNSKDFVDGNRFVIQYLDQLISHLKEFRPDGVCPNCDGAACDKCRGAGLVPAELYKQLKDKK